MGPIGLPELGIVLVVVLLIFGPKRLPQMGRSLGSGMREFKDGITGRSSPDDEADAEDARHREIAAARAVDEPAVAPPAAKDPQGSPPS